MKIKPKIVASYTDFQISLFSNNVMNWYNAFFIQTNRLLETEEERKKAIADKEELMPDQVEKYLWLTTLHHTVDGIRTLKAILDYRDDHRLEQFCDSLVGDGFADKVDACRNANEHFDEYLCGQGHFMEEFECDLSVPEDRTIRSNQHWTVIFGDKWFIGGLDVLETVEHMKIYATKIISCLKKITDEYWMKGLQQ